jgi:hypothetical protein
MDIIRYIWQLPQHLVAIIYWVWLYLRDQLVYGEFNKDYILYTKKTKGSVTLGKYIFASENAGDKIIMHESGHVKQSLYLGPLYLIVIGLPSLIWAMTYKKVFHCDDYFSFYTEAWANKLGGVSF